MKTFLKILFSTLSLVALAACNLQTREDIQKQNDERQLKEQVTTIQQQRADNDERYSEVQGDLRTIAGRVDTIDHNEQVSQQQSAKDIDSLKKLIATQNDKITMLEQHIDATETRLTAAIQALANNPPPAASHGDSTAADGGKKGNHPLWDDAESLFSKKDFKEAILKYQAYMDKNPKGTKLPEATYKIGVCFAELGHKKEAKEFYQATLDTYPKSASAKKAKFRLSQLK